MQCDASGNCACFGGKHRASSVKRRPYSAAADNVVLTQREVMNDSEGLGDATAEGNEHGDVTNQELDLSSPGIISQVTLIMFWYIAAY